MNSHDFIHACFDHELATVFSGQETVARRGPALFTWPRSARYRIAFHRDHDHDHDHDAGGGYGAGHTGRFAGPARRTFTVGIAGPVGSGKTAVVERLCRDLWPQVNLAVITNDIYTHEDAEFLSRREVLPLERIVGVQTGGCPHTAIRDDASANLSAIANFERQFPQLEMIVIESGGDNLTACFSRELADAHIFVIDVAEGDKIPRKGGPGISQSDLLIINKIDLAPHVGADLDVMRRDSRKMRGEKPFLMISLRQGDGAEELSKVGPSAIRITAETFLTPPEFDGLRLADRSAGQIGGVRLELLPPDRKSAARPGAKTRLGECYQQVPVRVLPPFHFDGEPAGLVYLLNPTAGLMDGDAHWLEIATTPGARAVVTSQSATRIHPCPRNFSTQQWKIRVAPSSELVVLPGPTIPFQGARSYQRVEIDLDDEARFIWSEIWHPGRYDRGELSERFQFRSLIQETQVRRRSRLVYRDRFHWQGPWNGETIGWHLGTHLACGSLFVTGSVDEGSFSWAEQVETAVMPLASGDTCIRYLGSPAAVTQAVVRTALFLAGTWSTNSDAKPWLLSSDGLAKNHWFLA